MRTFESGATRDSDEDKLDFEGFLSPSVLFRYAIYMSSHRKQTDGKLRASDNWKKGIPRIVYLKSLFRHFMCLWYRHHKVGKATSMLEDSLCAIIFNASGYLHEILKEDSGE